MALAHIELHTGPQMNGFRLTIDGHEISCVRSLTISDHVDKIPVLTVEIYAESVEVVMDGDVRLDVVDFTRIMRQQDIIKDIKHG